MKKVLIGFLILIPFCACYSYDYKAAMDDYFENYENKINEDRDRAEVREAQRQQAETNRAIQKKLSPLNNVNKPNKTCPG